MSDCKVAVVTSLPPGREVFRDAVTVMVTRQTVQSHEWIVVDGVLSNSNPTDRTRSSVIDQFERVTKGVRIATESGADRILIMEEDDHYPSDYIETMLSSWDKKKAMAANKWYTPYDTIRRVAYNFVPRSCPPFHVMGFTPALYWQFYDHVGKLYDPTAKTTDRPLVIDYALWKFVRSHEIPVDLLDVPEWVVSLKHNIGVTVSALHRDVRTSSSTFKYPGRVNDKNLSWLRSHVAPDMFEWYCDNVISPITS